MKEVSLIIYFSAIVLSVFIIKYGYKSRFLPTAFPLTVLSLILSAVSLVSFFEIFFENVSQWFQQLFLDLNFILVTLIVPYLFFMILEYYFNKKVHLNYKLLLLSFIHPVILYVLITIDIYTNSFLSPDPNVFLIPTEERLGDYNIFREYLNKSMTLFLLVFLPLSVLKNKKSTIKIVLLFIGLTTLPIVLFWLYRNEYIEYRLAPPALILFLFILSRQYRLLDFLPIAINNILHEVNSGILVNDLHSKLLYSNDHARKLLGLSVTTKAMNQHKVNTPKLFENHFDFTKPDEQFSQLTILDDTKSNEEDCVRYINASLRPIFNPNTNEHLGSTLSLYDVTEQKHIELALKSLDKQKTKFFAGISHEFRTPLTLSLGHLDNIIDKVDISSDFKKAALLAKRNNERLLHLVDQLLELSKIDSGSQQLNPTVISLESYLQLLIANFESLAEQQNINIHLIINEQNSSLLFDKPSFDKVIFNLLSNALKSINNGGDVYITVSSENGQSLQLSIRDTGCGIPSEKLPNIFEMFYSHDNGNTAWPLGSGVGLSLVKQLITLHNSDIRVESIVNEGTTFTLSFPTEGSFLKTESSLALETDNKIGSVESTRLVEVLSETMTDLTIENNVVLDRYQSASSPDNKLIIVAEDNNDMRSFICGLLTKDYFVLQAGNGEDALELAETHTPDLILSDVMMPIMNGIDLCEKLKSNIKTSHIPVLLLTARSGQNEKNQGLEQGADDYLSKPFDKKELKLRMSNLISARSMIKEYFQSRGLQKTLENTSVPKNESDFLGLLKQYVLNHMNIADIKVSDLATEVNMNERNFSRKLKSLTGETPKKVLQVIRLEYAADLLETTDENISALGYRAGFADASYFARHFKSHFSMTPTEYREKLKQDL